MARYSLRVFGRTVYERLTDTDTSMTDLMKSGEEHDDTDPWADTPFTQIDKLEGFGDRKNAVARENAERILDKLRRDGEIATDEAVEQGMKPLAGPESRLTAYYLNAGPVAHTADGVRWNTAFYFNPDEAPEYGSDAYFEAASELSIPDTDRMKLVPKKVEKCYRYFEQVTERNDAPRAIHPEELKLTGPRMKDRLADRAFEYLAELPGVIPPEESGPAWERVDAENPAVTGETAEVEG